MCGPAGKATVYFLLNTNRKVYLAYIGEFAEKPRYQGGGSAISIPFRVVSALDAAREKGRSVTYAKEIFYGKMTR